MIEIIGYISIGVITMKNLGLGLLIFGLALLVISALTLLATVFNVPLNGQNIFGLSIMSLILIFIGSITYTENK